jgi:hypothetical protein
MFPPLTPDRLTVTVLRHAVSADEIGRLAVLLSDLTQRVTSTCDRSRALRDESRRLRRQLHAGRRGRQHRDAGKDRSAASPRQHPGTQPRMPDPAAG